MLRTALARIRIEDPVLRILALTTIVATLGRGVFLTLATLYMSLVVGLPAGQIALVFGVGAVVAIVFALIGGHLADRISARRIALVALVVGSLALVGYAFVTSLVPVLVLVCIENAAISVGQSARSAILGRAFSGGEAVHARSVLRTLTNVGIGIGSGVASIPLAFGTPFAYRLAFVIAAVVVTIGQLPLIRLPARVDAPGLAKAEPSAEDASSGRLSRAEFAALSPWRDPRYLVFALLSGVLAVQFMIQEVGAPLWISQQTAAPPATLSAVLIVNTIVVIIFTVPLSRGTHDLRVAARVTLIGGGLLVVTCLAYALAAGLPPVWAVVILVTAALVGGFAEVLSQAGGWGLSFEMANPVRMGSYQGIYGTSYALGSAVGPALIAATAIAWGMPGWLLLAGMFLVAAVGTAVIAWHALRWPGRAHAVSAAEPAGD